MDLGSVEAKVVPQASRAETARCFRQTVISRSRPALTPPPARSPAPPLPVEHKYRVLAPGGYSIVASEVNLSQRAGCSLSLFALQRDASRLKPLFTLLLVIDLSRSHPVLTPPPTLRPAPARRISRVGPKVTNKIERPASRYISNQLGSRRACGAGSTTAVRRSRNTHRLHPLELSLEAKAQVLECSTPLGCWA